MKRPTHYLPYILIFVSVLSHAAVPPPPDSLTETTISWDSTGSVTLNSDGEFKAAGFFSLRAEIPDDDGVTLFAPSTKNAQWDLSGNNIVGLAFRMYALNPNNFQFDNRSPTIRLYSTDTDFREYKPNREILNDQSDFVGYGLSLAGGNGWTAEDTGTFDASNVNWISFGFDTWGDQTYEVWLDDLQFVTPSGLKLDASQLVLQQGWRWMNLDPLIPALGTFIPISRTDVTWSSAAPSIASVSPDGVVEMIGIGNVIITASINGFSSACLFTSKPAARQPVINTVPDELSTSAPNAIFDIPVLILRFLPTSDGSTLDTDQARGFDSADPEALSTVEDRLLRADRLTKFMIEEGSRFRGYKDRVAIPSLGIRVVRMITIYEQTPPGDDLYGNSADGKFRIDYERIFERFNVQEFIEEEGGKEVWIWSGGAESTWPSYDINSYRPEYSRRSPESNMSSPTTSDISNSDRRSDDLPQYNRTYTVYGNNIKGTHADVMQTRGQQLEALLAHVAREQDGNDDLFLQEFVGTGTGRAGSILRPPNTTVNEDYTNPASIRCDIEDWKPGGGPSRPINFTRWRDLNYDWPDTPGFAIPRQTESQYHLYWLQSIPGYANKIPYTVANRWVNNWWMFMADWDMATLQSKGLHGPPAFFLPPKLFVESNDEDIILQCSIPAGNILLLEHNKRLGFSEWQSTPPLPIQAIGGARISMPISPNGYWRALAIPVAGSLEGPGTAE